MNQNTDQISHYYGKNGTRDINSDVYIALEDWFEMDYIRHLFSEALVGGSKSTISDDLNAN